MAVDIHALGIDRLTVRERLDLIAQIWDTLPEQIEPSEVPDWHVEEIAKRLAQLEANPNIGRPWREVFGEIEGDV